MKNCKFCMTEISAKARICPQCRQSLTLTSAISGFLRNGAWMISAIVSFGFAAFEKAEKYGYAEELKAVVNELDLANMTSSVLRSQVVNPLEVPARLLASGELEQNDGRMMARDVEGASLDAEDELQRIDARLHQELLREPRNETLMRQLIARQQYLRIRNP